MFHFLAFTIDPNTSSALLLGAIVATSGTMSPLLLSWLTTRSRRKDDAIRRSEDYARQDAVAKQTAVAARLLSDRQDEIAGKAAEAARLLVVNTAKVAESTKTNNSAVIVKLDIIHTLVNSNMTAAMQAELNATRRELAMMHEVVELKKAAGKEPSVDALAAIESTKSRISELTSALEDRKVQADTINKQAAEPPT